MHSFAALDIQKLPRDVDALLGVITDLHTQYSTILESLRQQLQNLRRMHFGATSEKLSGQPELFQQTQQLPVPPQDLITVSYQRQRRGRPSLPKDLPRERVDYDLSDAEKAEFDALEKIGEEVSETLEYTPAKLIVIEHARAKYACHKDGESTIRTAFAQPSPLPKSNAGAGLLAQILVSTFADHLPLNRQEMIFKRHGVDLPRSTLCEWKLASGELLAILRAPLIAHLLNAPRLHTDDTTMPLIEGGRGCTKTARLWGYLGAGARQNEVGEWVEHAPAVVFEFTDSRESKHPVKFLKDYQGYLQADAYSGYDILYSTGRIIEVGCLAHYLVHQITRTAEESFSKSPTRRRPLALQPRLLPQGPLGLAFGYALNHWRALTRYTENGVLVPDNNLMESAIRPIAMGRKAYLFAAAERGGHVAATLYSLVGTCKLNRIEPYAYLKDVLRRLPSHPVNRLSELLPFNWKPTIA